MLQYLVILLDDTSVSYCHYQNTKTERKLIDLDALKSGILFAMKQNLTVQFVFPDYEIPQEYKNVVETIDHTKICPSSFKEENADILCVDNLDKLPINQDKILVCRTSKDELFADYERLIPILENVTRLNIVLTDIEDFLENDFPTYKNVLEKLLVEVQNQYSKGKNPQVNLLTDRILLDKMNNCNAGVENITLAPNGKFYICPAFYYEDKNDNVGNLATALNIKNAQLYKFDYAPICKKCDAFQCKRCVWLNRKTTKEVNTPSHEQCVVAHLERNASRQLLQNLQKLGGLLDKEITEIDYLDPFDIINTH
jgi:CXXX repeat peptide maturase